MFDGSRTNKIEIRDLRPADLDDPLTPVQRSQCMSRIGSTDTTPELMVRRALHARGWPAGAARVEITVESRPGGCEVWIEEDATSGPALLVPKQLRQSAIELRNRESLRRLAYLAEGRAARRSSDPL